MRFGAARSARISSTACACAPVSAKGSASRMRCASAPGADLRAAGDRAHPRAHQQQRELVGEQFVIGEPRRAPARPGRRRRASAGDAARAALRRSSAREPAQRRLRRSIPAVAAGARAPPCGRLGDDARIKPFGQAIDRLDRRHPGELLGVHHPVGMDHLQLAVPQLQLAGHPARRADRQALLDPLDLARKNTSSTSPVSSSTSTLYGALRARARRRAMLDDARLDRGDRVALGLGDFRPGAAVDAPRRADGTAGRRTRAPCGRSSSLSMSLAFFGPTPGSVAAGANSGSSNAGRMPLYTGAPGDQAKRPGRVKHLCPEFWSSPTAVWLHGMEEARRRRSAGQDFRRTCFRMSSIS